MNTKPNQHFLGELRRSKIESLTILIKLESVTYNDKIMIRIYPYKYSSMETDILASFLRSHLTHKIHKREVFTMNSTELLIACSRIPIIPSCVLGGTWHNCIHMVNLSSSALGCVEMEFNRFNDDT